MDLFSAPLSISCCLLLTVKTHLPGFQGELRLSESWLESPSKDDICTRCVPPVLASPAPLVYFFSYKPYSLVLHTLTQSIGLHSPLPPPSHSSVSHFHYKTEWIWPTAWITSPHLARPHFPQGRRVFFLFFIPSLCGGRGPYQDGLSPLYSSSSSSFFSSYLRTYMLGWVKSFLLSD